MGKTEVYKTLLITGDAGLGRSCSLVPCRKSGLSLLKAPWQLRSRKYVMETCGKNHKIKQQKLESQNTTILYYTHTHTHIYIYIYISDDGNS